MLDDVVFPRLVDLIEQGAVRPLVARSFPLASLSEAQAFFLNKQFTGKVVIDMALERAD